MKTNKFLLFAIIAILSACHPDGARSEGTGEEEIPPIVTEKHDSQYPAAASAPAWQGTFTGTVPCADCEGIKTTVVLNPDMSFTKTDEYLGKKGETFNEAGKFTVDTATSVITLVVGDMDYKFKAEGNQLRMLGSDGKTITGPLENNYILARAQ